MRAHDRMQRGALLLLAVHAAGFVLVAVGGVIRGWGHDPLGTMVAFLAQYAFLFGGVQVVYAAVLAGLLRVGGRPAEALGVVAACALTFVAWGTCALLVVPRLPPG